MKKRSNNLISVIVPVYNSTGTVARCIKSICDQTYSNLEIIVVYKQGDDNSLSIIKSFNDSRIKVIHQTENTGPGGARNIGIDNATGDWLGFVEADDYIAPDYYEKLLTAAMQNDCEIAQAQIVHKNWRIQNTYAVYKKYYNKLRALHNGATFDKIFKTEFVRRNNIRFMESVRWEDNPFIFRALYFGDIVVGVDTKYFYDAHEWSAEYATKLKQDILPVCHEIIDFANSVKLTPQERKLVKHKIIDCIARHFIDDRDIYCGLAKLLHRPLFLVVMHYKKIIKQKHKRIKND